MKVGFQIEFGELETKDNGNGELRYTVASHGDTQEAGLCGGFQPEAKLY